MWNAPPHLAHVRFLTTWITWCICRYLQFPQSFSLLVLCFWSRSGGPGGQGTGAEFSRKTLGGFQVLCSIVFKYFSRVSLISFILFGRVVPIFPMWTMDPISAFQRESSQKIEQAVLAWIKLVPVQSNCEHSLNWKNSKWKEGLKRNNWSLKSNWSNWQLSSSFQFFSVLFSSFQSSSIQLFC